MITLATRPNVNQSYFLARLPENPRAIVLLFPGSGGNVRLRHEKGQIRFGQNNFVIRTRQEYVKRNVAAAFVDTPSDMQSGWGMSDEFRLGAEHFADISAVVQDLHKRLPNVPLYLVGTSRGTISAAALAARFGAQVAGVVLTSTMFRATGRRSKEPGAGLSRFDFSSIKTPLLFVHHVDDQCAVTPYGDAARLGEKYPLISVSGGSAPESGPCEPFSQHGYLGKESETVEQITNWILKKPFSSEVK